MRCSIKFDIKWSAHWKANQSPNEWRGVYKVCGDIRSTYVYIVENNYSGISWSAGSWCHIPCVVTPPPLAAQDRHVPSMGCCSATTVPCCTPCWGTPLVVLRGGHTEHVLLHPRAPLGTPLSVHEAHTNAVSLWCTHFNDIIYDFKLKFVKIIKL